MHITVGKSPGEGPMLARVATILAAERSWKSSRVLRQVNRYPEKTTIFNQRVYICKLERYWVYPRKQALVHPGVRRHSSSVND